jgi:hypothetical protein
VSRPTVDNLKEEIRQLKDERRQLRSTLGLDPETGEKRGDMGVAVAVQWAVQSWTKSLLCPPGVWGASERRHFPTREEAQEWLSEHGPTYAGTLFRIAKVTTRKITYTEVLE